MNLPAMIISELSCFHTIEEEGDSLEIFKFDFAKIFDAIAEKPFQSTFQTQTADYKIDDPLIDNSDCLRGFFQLIQSLILDDELYRSQIE